jgi:hypothetical protein
MTDKHTPGPWTWHRSANFIVAPRKTVCENIAATSPAGFAHHTEETEANARLIVAAPAMLAALREIVTEDGATCMRNGMSAATLLRRRIESINTVARAVIEQATKE